MVHVRKCPHGKRGNPTTEFYIEGKPQIYCQGYIDAKTDEPLDVCINCKDFVGGEQCDIDFQKSQKRVCTCCVGRDSQLNNGDFWEESTEYIEPLPELKIGDAFYYFNPIDPDLWDCVDWKRKIRKYVISGFCHDIAWNPGDTQIRAEYSKRCDPHFLWTSFFGKSCFLTLEEALKALHQISIRSNKCPQRVCSWVYNSNTAKQHRDIAFYGIEPCFTNAFQPYKNPNDKRIKELIAKGHQGGRMYDWWNVNQIKNVSKQKTEHPCQMPLEIMKNIISTLPEDVTVFDPFMGSGTTAVACNELGYDFVGCEIDAEYCNIAIRRVEAMQNG